MRSIGIVVGGFRRELAAVPRHGGLRRRSFRWRASLSPVVLASAFAAADVTADCIDYGSYIHLTGNIVLPGDDLFDVAISGNYAYVATFAGLRVIDITNPQNPQLVGSSNVGVNGVALSGNYAYVANPGGGALFTFHVLNITNPQSPQVVGFADIPGDGYDVAVSGNYAYLANFFNGLYVIDVSIPQSPVVVGHVNPPGNDWSVAVSGTLVYLGSVSLYVIDVSDPQNPQVLGSAPAFGSDIAISGNYAYLASDSAGLRVVDVSNPALPQIAGGLDIGSYDYGIAISGTTAFVANYGWISVVDISTPQSPRLVGKMPNFRTDDAAEAVAVAGNHAYVAYSNTEAEGCGLMVLDIANPNFAPLIGSLNTPGNAAFDIVVSGNLAYVPDGAAGLQVVDLTNAALPQIVGSVNTPGNAQDVAISGTLAYVADGGAGLQVVDITSPTAPQIVGGVDTPNNAMAVTIAGPYAYVADGSYSPGPASLKVIDISNSAVPQIVGTGTAQDGEFYDVAVSGTYAYTTGGYSTLIVFDVTNPAQPQRLSRVSAGYALSVVVEGPYAYVANGDQGLRLIDVSNPAAPQIVATLDTPGGALDMVLADDYAYVADGRHGLQILDLVDLGSNAPLVGGAITPGEPGFGWPGSARHVTLAGAYAIVTDGRVQILPRQCPRAPVGTGMDPALGAVQLLAPYPNPAKGRVAIPFSAGHGGSAELTVHDVAGREVARLFTGVLRPGLGEWTWSVHAGRIGKLPAGVYLLRLATPHDVQTRKVVLLE